MDAVGLQKRYLKVTKRYLILSGIWPDQRKSTQYISRVIIYIIVVPCILGQIARMICFFSMATVLQQLSFVLAMMLLLVKQGNYIVNDAKFKALLKGMFTDWEEDKTEEEIAIMISYMDRGAFFAAIYLDTHHNLEILSVFMDKYDIRLYMNNTFFSKRLLLRDAIHTNETWPWWPRIADILVPLNESRPRGYIFPVYYFVDDEKYYYWIIAHTTFVIFTTMCGFIACDIYFIYAVQHACGLLAVTGYVREFDDLHYGYLLICIGVIVAAFSGTLLWISRLPISSQFCQYCIFLMVQLMHIFFLTLQGQFVINSMDDVYNDIYEGLWYNTMPNVQALFILALRSAKVTPQITAGGRIPMNLQTFAAVIHQPLFALL
ncbi:uncharacterized protein LOC143264050 [Megachile rotundata]|uniref:uncharacterized protein LOC143264050 n=1 Tax=Megachile rotundata TaxID=143995 RepID=UPI003FD1A02B